MEKQQTSTLAALGITGVWLIVALFVMSRHELWLDEAHHWLLARDSKSIMDMLENMRYEGHPPFWNILLFVIACFADSPDTMQYVHLVFAGGTVFLIASYAPFPLWVKMILPFTYFLGYEYAIIARNYAPAVFFILLACVWSKNYERNQIRISIVLGLALLFHLYASCFAIALLIYFQWKYVERGKSRGRLWISMTIVGLCALIAFWSLSRVPADHFIEKYHASLFEFNRIGTVLLLPFTSLFHVPPPTGEFWWNQNMFLQGSDVVKGIIGLLFWCVPALMLRKNRPEMILYLGGVLLLSGIMWLTPMAVTLRHAGFVALMFFVSVWLGGNTLFGSRFFQTMISLLLIAQVAGYAITVLHEWSKPFSNAGNVAEFVKDNYQNVEVAAYPDFIRPSVALYMRRDIYFPEARGNFASWSSKSMEIKNEEFLAECQQRMNENKLDSMIVISHNGFPMFEVGLSESESRALFLGATVSAENYKVYILKAE